MSSARASEAREVLTKAETVLREDGHDTNADVIAELREEFYPAPPAPETVTVEYRDGTLATLSLEGKTWLNTTTGRVVERDSHVALLDRIASDARVLAELRDENTQLKREVDWITERASSARIAANTFERERDRATADRDAGLRVLAEREVEKLAAEANRRVAEEAYEAEYAKREQAESGLRAANARIAELEKASADYLRELNAFNTRVTELQSERDAALRALRERDEKTSAASAPAFGDLGPLDAEMTISVWAKDAASASEPRSAATPIPLGAVVSTTEYDYEFDRLSRQWECMQGDPPVGRPVDAEVEALCDLAYRIQHPVATRETVERVALDAWRDVGKVELRHVRQIVDHTYKAAGFTLEGA